MLEVHAVWGLLIIFSEPPFPHLQDEERNMMPTSWAIVRLPRDDAGKALKTVGERGDRRVPPR